jgi:hypothetical protein
MRFRVEGSTVSFPLPPGVKLVHYKIIDTIQIIR